MTPGRGHHAPHVLGPGGGWVDAGDEGGSGRGTHRGTGPNPGVAKAAAGHVVDIRCCGKAVSVAAHLRPVIFTDQPDDILAFGGLERRAGQEKCWRLHREGARAQWRRRPPARSGHIPGFTEMHAFPAIQPARPQRNEFG